MAIPELRSTLLDPFTDLVHEKTDGGGSLPLHVAACNLTVPTNALRRRVSRSPDAVRAWTSDGRLPLHLAALYGAHVGSVRCLVEHYPELIQITDRNGNLPLRLAGSVQPDRRPVSGASHQEPRRSPPGAAMAEALDCLETLRVLSEARPEALRRPDVLFWEYECDYPDHDTIS